jgi:hypothetical protein
MTARAGGRFGLTISKTPAGDTVASRASFVVASLLCGPPWPRPCSSTSGRTEDIAAVPSLQVMDETPTLEPVGSQVHLVNSNHFAFGIYRSWESDPQTLPGYRDEAQPVGRGQCVGRRIATRSRLRRGSCQRFRWFRRFCSAPTGGKQRYRQPDKGQPGRVYPRHKASKHALHCSHGVNQRPAAPATAKPEQAEPREQSAYVPGSGMAGPNVVNVGLCPA